MSEIGGQRSEVSIDRVSYLTSDFWHSSQNFSPKEIVVTEVLAAHRSG